MPHPTSTLSFNNPEVFLSTVQSFVGPLEESLPDPQRTNAKKESSHTWLLSFTLFQSEVNLQASNIIVIPGSQTPTVTRWCHTSFGIVLSSGRAALRSPLDHFT